MKTLYRCVFACGLMAVGYFLGTTGVFTPASVRAQDAAADGLPDEILEQVKSANEALNVAMQSLQQEGLYQPAIIGVNAFVVSVGGGVNALQDLESGRGVDPETFAGLYAGQATEEVDAELGRDDEGRLTYKNKIVRMYPISRLKAMYAARAGINGEAAP